MRGTKRGEDKYWLIASMILGLIVASILIFFIFERYFTEEDINFETCRQSVVLRANAPEIKEYDTTFASFKKEFPLKCKTEVVEVTKEDVQTNRSTALIGEALARCWALFGNGGAKVFPSPLKGVNTHCVPCARIHLTDDAKSFIKQSPSREISLSNMLQNGFFRGVPYYNYLESVGTDFPALNPARTRPFNIRGSGFDVDDSDCPSQVFRKGAGEEHKDSGAGFCRVSLPGTFDVDNGDLVITYGSLALAGTVRGFNILDISNPLLASIFAEESGIGDFVPYLFYYQIDQKGIATELKTKFFDADFDFGINSVPICKTWEGIPA